MPKIKAIYFDFMGTCLDWHKGAVSVLPTTIPASERSDLALRWRQSYFDINKARLRDGLPPEDIDITLRQALLNTLAHELYSQHAQLFTDEVLDKCIQQWHSMPAWPEVPSAITALQSHGYETFVFANGTTRLQLDLCRSSGLSFDMLFSSQLLGYIKPDIRAYEKALELTRYRPEETVQVAAHASDLRGAKQAGIRTVYVKRWTDDVEEDVEQCRREFDYFLEDMEGLAAVLERIEQES